MLKLKIILILLSIVFVNTFAQTAKDEIFEEIEKSGGIYYAYPVPDRGLKSHAPVPKGYTAFYVSHFGRHGSRYLSKDDQYRDVMTLLDKASDQKALSPLGLDVLTRLKEVWVEAEGRGGDLSPLGVIQHRGIAERMYKSYPEAFAGTGISLTARSTPVVRCVLSMDAFCERLKELNPQLTISRDGSVRYNSYLNYHTPEAVAFRYSPDTWREQYNRFETTHVSPGRLMSILFSDNRFVEEHIDAKALMWGLYYIAVGMQNINTLHSFFDLFDKQELFDLWQCCNYQLYVTYANSSLNKGLMMENAKPLLQDMIDRAEQHITEKTNGADLRFGHDGNIIPLAMLMHLEGCYNSISEPSEFYKAWADFSVAPMGGNVQMVFFRKQRSEDILVKFLLHENEILLPEVDSDLKPYYHWKDVKEYYTSFLK